MHLIFQNEALDCYALSLSVIAHVREYFSSYSSLGGRNLLLNNFSSTDAPFLFSVAVWNRDAVQSGVGFHLSNYNFSLACAGCCSTQAESDIEADALALRTALQCSMDLHILCKHIFVASEDLFIAIKRGNPQTLWRLDPLIANILNLLSAMNFPQLHIIPRSWMRAAFSLANLNTSKHDITLFH